MKKSTDEPDLLHENIAKRQCTRLNKVSIACTSQYLT